LKSSRLVAPGEPLEVAGKGRVFVSRGGEKLDGALSDLGVDPGGRYCLDAGASTGGFTDCLLLRGATKVVALDVGAGLLHERLRCDPRVVVVESTNLRHAEPVSIGAPFDLVVADLSFISLTKVAGRIVQALDRVGGEALVLVKPQFEAGRVEASKGRGVVRDPAVWVACLHEVAVSFEQEGAVACGVVPSPIRGASGNVEFFLHARLAGLVEGRKASSLEEMVERAVDRAARRP